MQDGENEYDFDWNEKEQTQEDIIKINSCYQITN